MSPATIRLALIALAAVALFGIGAYAGWDTATARWTAKYEARERQWQELVNQELEKARAAETAAQRAIADARDHHATAVRALHADLDTALGELRRAKARAALKPADAAPAPCRGYAASPTQLSEPDAEFLIRFAAEADDVAIRLGTCQRYVNAVLTALTGMTK